MTDYLSYSSSRSLKNTVDWWIVGLYLVIVIFGWMNIYASVQTEEGMSIFDWSNRAGKQFVWIITAVCLALTVLFVIPIKVYEPIAPVLYAVTALLLVAVIFIGGNVKGSHSWFTMGPISFQPAEISKITTSLLLATVMSSGTYQMKGKSGLITFAIIALPMLIIIAENETGSALVYLGFVFMLYREGLSGWIIFFCALAVTLFILTLVVSPLVGLTVAIGVTTLMDSIFGSYIKWWLIGAIVIVPIICLIPEQSGLVLVSCVIGIYAVYSLWKAVRGIRQTFRYMTLVTLLCSVVLVVSTRVIFDKVLKDHQRGRIEVLLGMKEDLSGLGYNVHQSKIAIGSGGLIGKGFCKGTQTAYGFVPEQSTDFIFCTVGEEWGFIGSTALILLYVFLLVRIILDCENSRGAFTRIYGYCLAGCLFMHLVINIGMTLGIMPVIGIPLPLMSYGGSSLWTFTVMIFIFVALVRNERKYF